MTSATDQAWLANTATPKNEMIVNNSSFLINGLLQRMLALNQRYCTDNPQISKPKKVRTQLKALDARLTKSEANERMCLLRDRAEDKENAADRALSCALVYDLYGSATIRFRYVFPVFGNGIDIILASRHPACVPGKPI